MGEKIDMSDLVGGPYEFYGVFANSFKLDDQAYEVLENEQDGYRSTLDHVRETADFGFFPQPIATVGVQVLDDGYTDGWRLVDSDGHVWLEFGTANYNDYYPMFVFKYQPKEAKHGT